ncbi:MAG: 16S rRNA (cytosine(967)-C(5))-methyltransferase RsmB [Desulfobacteraceae bacterium]|nr:MAG: 16S rRNA (cytosine(967)-C(5))-methyltransferase RsmB [Desulfobacteraceae bacterium]
MSNDPRHIALMILIHTHKDRITLDHCIDRFEQELTTLDQRDRNLCYALVMGTFRHRARLDWIFSKCASRSIEKTDPYALTIIRMALFQVMYMDKIPASAAVNTAVNLAKKAGQAKISGFVNAVLRKAVEQHPSIALPDINKNPVLCLSVTHSQPQWLVKRWIKRYGLDLTRELCRTLNHVPAITLRVNTLKTDRNTLVDHLDPMAQRIELTLLSPVGINIDRPKVPLSSMDALKNGWFQIQDEAAQMVTLLLDPQPGERVLDACAGLGGKTGHLAQLMKNQGEIIALDSDKNRLDKMAPVMADLGVDMVTPVRADLLKSSIKTLGGYFDRILLDAPCTGLGVLRRNPDSRWGKGTKDIQRNAARQKKLLNHTANMLKPGGFLLYTVCSCEPEENMEVITHFLDKRKDYILFQDTARLLSSKTGQAAAGNLIDNGVLCTFPLPGTMDGFFAALLQRRDRPDTGPDLQE